MSKPEDFDRQLQRAWKGDYSAAPTRGPAPPTRGPAAPTRGPAAPTRGPAPSWDAPLLEGAPADREGARRQSRRQIESIVETEAVSLSSAEIGAAQRPEAGMKLAKFVKFREEKFGGVLFETRNEKVYTLNPTGAAVVREILAGSNDIVATLKARYEDKDGKMAAEALAFLDELKSKGLVEA